MSAVLPSADLAARPVRPAEMALFPFNRLAYAEGLDNIGTPVLDPTRRVVLLKRPIPGSARFDGIGPWPYLWVDDGDDLAALRDGFADLVTVTAVTQPGFDPRGVDPSIDAALLKQHFVFDPLLPTPPLSKRSRQRLRRAEEVGNFEIVDDRAERMAIAPVYDGLLGRRGLKGGLFDFPSAHFEAIADLPESTFFRAARAGEIGAMACGIVHDDMLQILHTAISETGLAWHASYLLMRGMQDHARERGLRLLTGGMPDGARDGLRTFKLRWANSFAPVHLVRIVNDQAAYHALGRGRDAGGSDYFPAYRAPSTAAAF